MKMKSDVLIVGGGSTGLMISYYLLKKGVRSTIIERKYPGSGNTYKCATGIRASFTSREHIALMKRAIELWSELRDELGVFYERSGYLWLLSREEDLKMFKTYVSFQNELGVPTKVIDLSEVKRLAPTIVTKDLLAAVYDPLAGKASPFDLILRSWQLLVEKGCKVLTGVEVKKILLNKNGVLGVETSAGSIESSTVVLATAYDTVKLLEPLNISIPIKPVPKHAFITEAYRDLFKPLIIDWTTSSYIVQTPHGNFLVGSEISEKYSDKPLSKLKFLHKASKVWVKYFPWMKEVYLLRYWTGYYDMTPDHHPIIGPLDDLEGLYIAAGFSGHGFMMSPSVGEIMADWIIEGRPKVSEALSLSVSRFRKGELIKEVAVFG